MNNVTSSVLSLLILGLPALPTTAQETSGRKAGAQADAEKATTKPPPPGHQHEPRAMEDDYILCKKSKKNNNKKDCEHLRRHQMPKVEANDLGIGPCQGSMCPPDVREELQRHRVRPDLQRRPEELNRPQQSKTR